MVPEERRIEERVVYFRPRTILVVLGIILAALVFITLVYLAWHVITWILIAVFLAAALNPAVEFLERRGIRRGLASILVVLPRSSHSPGSGFLVIPPLVTRCASSSRPSPTFVEDLTEGRGPLGFLERDYQIVDKRPEGDRGRRAPAASLGVTDAGARRRAERRHRVVGVVTIAFLTFFMLLEGPDGRAVPGLAPGRR